jgi:hypothetical protein
MSWRVKNARGMQAVSTDTRKVYTPVTWVGRNYSTLWGCYRYGCGSVYVPRRQGERR